MGSHRPASWGPAWPPRSARLARVFRAFRPHRVLSTPIKTTVLSVVPKRSLAQEAQDVQMFFADSESSGPVGTSGEAVSSRCFSEA